MKCGTAHFVIACILVLSAGLGASAARHVPSSSHRRLAQAGQPQGCQGITFSEVTAVTSSRSGASSPVSGIVVISTTPGAPTALGQVLVQALTKVPGVAPVLTRAICGAISPAGTLTCTYQVNLPNGPAGPVPAAQAYVQASVNTGIASCYSAITPITVVQVGEGHGVMDYSQGSSSTESPQAMPATSNGGRRLSQADDLQMARAGSVGSAPAVVGNPFPPSTTEPSHSGSGPAHSSGGRRLSQAGVQQAQPGSLGYVPTGCQGMSVNTFLYDIQQPDVITGTVVLTNPNTFDIPITSVKVGLASNVVLEPMFTTAICPGSVVPTNPEPYTVGELVCGFTFVLPANGPASIWTSAKATATIAMSNADCSSPVVPVRAGPFVMGH